MKQILTRLLIFAICCIMCIHTFSICTRSVIYILLAIILAFGTILIADRLSPAALTLIHAGIFILCCMIPELVVFLPLFCFYLSKRPVCFTAPIGVLSIILASAKLPMDTLLLIGVLCLCSILYGYLTTALTTLHQQMKHLTDTSETNELLAKERIRMIRKEQDNRIYTATLKERNRIAREIHDNVGHMLSRSILMVGALKTVNQAENLKVPMEQLNQTLNEAMTNVRQSVHDLHDESVNLKEVMESLAEEFSFCPVQLTYDMGYDIPKEIKYSFIAITKEALNNVMRHSNANEVKILAREHPGLYQLIIEDNGTSDKRIQSDGDGEEYTEQESAGKTENARKTENTESSGIGIENMKKRVRMLGGTMQIQKENGFRIFITVPKNEGKR